MADQAVSFLLDNIGALVEEARLKGKVRAEFNELKAELESIKSLLIESDARKENKLSFKAWIEQVREVAYDIEDILDDYTLSTTQAIDDHQRHFLWLKRWRANHRLDSEIDDLKKRVLSIKERKERYTRNNPAGGSNSGTSITNKLHDSREDALLARGAELVGIQNRRDELIKWLLSEEKSKLGVVSLFGTGGLGKTTLVKEIFDNRQVKEQFKFQAWITVKESCNRNDLLRDLINQLNNEGDEASRRQIATMEAVNLRKVLHDYLQGKRYLVVLDDIWRMDALNAVKLAFPDGEYGSRLIVTTRFHDIAQSATQLGTHRHPYEMQPLPREDAWTLFCKKAFKSDFEKTSCSQESINILQKILKICEGLPLGIVAIAGLVLSKPKTLVELAKVHRSLGWHLENNPLLSDIRTILSLSYNDLPYHLKSCFLYFSIFPRNYAVDRRKLLRLWMAERFVEKGHDGMTTEEVADIYLDELIKRSLIEIEHTDLGGRVRTCRVHDLMHEIIRVKAREQNLNTVLVEQDDVEQLPQRIRRLSIFYSDKNIPSRTKFPHLRSFFMFGMSDLSKSIMSAILSNLKLLKVMDLEDAPIEDFPTEITNLFQLRYLSMKNTKIRSIPSSLGKLKNLETLDLKGTHVTELPVEILKLRRLRHLLAYHHCKESFGGKIGMRLPIGIGNLITLEKLSLFDASKGSAVVKELKMLTQLSRLGITNLESKDGLHLCASVEKMKHLRSLDVTSTGEDELLDIQTLVPPPLLECVTMTGILKKFPDWISRLQALGKLQIVGSRLKGEPLTSLQALPNLTELKLQEAYGGEELCFKAKGFPRLSSMDLIGLHELKLVTVEEGAMLSIERINFENCMKLEVPSGIEHLTTLKKIHYSQMHTDFTNKIGSRDRWKSENFPFITSGREWWRTAVMVSKATRKFKNGRKYPTHLESN